MREYNVQHWRVILYAYNFNMSTLRYFSPRYFFFFPPNIGVEKGLGLYGLTDRILIPKSDDRWLAVGPPRSYYVPSVPR